MALSQNAPYQEIGTRIDTIFEQRFIDGKLTTIRRIIRYDSVVVIPKLRMRKGDFLMNNKSHSYFPTQFPDFSSIKAPLDSKNKYFSTEFGLSATLWHNTIQPQKPDLGLISPVYKIERTTNPIVTAGIYANSIYHRGDWYFKTGAALQTGLQNTKFDVASIRIDSTLLLKPFEYDSMIIDTLYVLDIAQLPDTVYFTFVDTFYRTVQDTLVQTNYDSVLTEGQYQLTNRYFYLEMPIMLGREFTIRKTKLSLEAGLIFSLLIRVRLRLSSEEYSIRQLSDKYAQTLNLGFAGGVSWRLPVFDSRYIKLSAGIRYDFSNLYRNHNYHVRKKVRSSFAIGYYFN